MDKNAHSDRAQTDTFGESLLIQVSIFHEHDLMTLTYLYFSEACWLHFPFGTVPLVFFWSLLMAIPRSYSQKNWTGVCGPLHKTLTLFMAKIRDFLYPMLKALWGAFQLIDGLIDNDEKVPPSKNHTHPIQDHTLFATKLAKIDTLPMQSG